MADEEVLDAEATTEETEGGDEPDFATRLKEAVQVDMTDAGTLRKRLTVTVPRETIDEQRSEQFDELSREALVPGFRKGRAPRALIVKRFGRDVGEQLKSEVLSRGYMAAIEKAGLKVIGDPELIVAGDDGGERVVSVEEAFDTISMPADGPMSFTCEVEIRPEFELPTLEGFEIKKPMIEITDEDVEKQVDRIRAMQGTYEPVVGKVKADDLVVVDLTLSIGGKEVKKEENVSVAARPQRVDGIALETLGDALVGKKAGDKVSIDAEVADDHPSADWRGKSARFDLVLHDVKRLALPPVDEAFLSGLGFESEKEFRGWVRDDMTSRLGDAIRDGLRGQVREYLLENTKVDLPKGLSHRQAERAAELRKIEMRRRGVPDSEIAKNLDELRLQARSEAISDLKLFFVMEKLSEDLDVHVGEDELNGQIALMAQRYNRRFDRMRDELAKGDGLTHLYLQMRDEKIIDLLITKARIVETEGPKKKAAKEPAKKSTAKKASSASKSKTED